MRCNLIQETDIHMSVGHLTHRVGCRRRSLVAKQHKILLIFFWIVKLTGQSSNPQKFYIANLMKNNFLKRVWIFDANLLRHPLVNFILIVPYFVWLAPIVVIVVTVFLKNFFSTAFVLLRCICVCRHWHAVWCVARGKRTNTTDWLHNQMPATDISDTREFKKKRSSHHGNQEESESFESVAPTVCVSRRHLYKQEMSDIIQTGCFHTRTASTTSRYQIQQ